MTHVIVLNGGSSSGKTSIARAIQELAPGTWLTFGVDTLIDSLPGRGQDPRSGLVFEPDGTVTVMSEFRALEESWYRGLATMARGGAHLILDEVFLGGAASQERLRSWLEGLDVLWVGVRCDAEVATTRELHRPDRVGGMAATQAIVVHAGVDYDVEVDTTHHSVRDCAQIITERVIS